LASHPLNSKKVIAINRERSPAARGPEIGQADIVMLGDLLGAAAVRTEEKFLVLGGRLSDFQRRSKEVARQAENISGLLLGDAAAETVSGLQSLVQGFGRQRSQMQAMTEVDQRALGEIHRLLDTLYDPLFGFRKIIKTLLSLGIATRIESSQAGRQDAGFLVFADDLKELSGLINSRSSHVLENLGGLRERCRNGAEKLTELQSGQHENAQELLQRAAAALAQMDSRAREASGKADAILSRLAGFAAPIGEIVASIQFQDIIRQKVMHVQHALADLATANLGGAAAAEICSLQAAQLQYARTEMDQAVGKVIESLHSLAEQIAHTAGQTREVAGIAGAAGLSVFHEFETVINGISLLLQEGEMVREEAAAAVGTVAESVDKMAGLLEEIEFLGEKMKVVALNAGIRAAHVGEKGAALGVIAEAIQQLSHEALILTRTLAGGFREIMVCARRLGDGAQDGVENPGGLLQKATALLERLQEINGRQVSQLREMDDTAAGLAEDLLQAAVTTDVHQAFSLDIESVLEKLRIFVPLSAAAGNGTDSTLYKDLMDRYTMHSEREIHQGKQGASPENKVIPLPRRRTAKIEHDLGDNVELFN